MPATREGLELKVLYREISGLEQKTIEGQFIERKTERFSLFLVVAFALLGLETIVTGRGSMRSRRKVLHTGLAGAAFLISFLFLIPPSLAKGIDRSRVKSGNQYFDSGEYEKAAVLYREALGDTTVRHKFSESVSYNEANSLHMLERYQEALGKYHASFSGDSLQAGQMMYNRANTLMKMAMLGEAIESYIQALQYLPDDSDARHNLELALRLRKEQQSQQQEGGEEREQQEGDEQDQDSQRQDSRSDDNRQQQNQQDQDASQAPDSSQVSQPSDPDSSQTQPPKEQTSIQLSREDALRILRLLEEQEKELQKAKRKVAIKRATKGKDW